jgi:hypothetical protein
MSLPYPMMSEEHKALLARLEEERQAERETLRTYREQVRDVIAAVRRELPRRGLHAVPDEEKE